MNKNIIFVGMMGCGKTTAAKELSKELKDYTLVDIDEEIEKSTQKKISEIFLTHGEPFFRMLENEKIKHFCSNNKKQIIALGGGAFENEENRKLLLSSGFVIYLKASPQEIYNRIKNEAENKRPLLRKNFSPEKIESILKLREKNYKKAHITIDTTGKTPYNIVREIVGVIYGT